MDAYLRRYMADPRHRLATAGPVEWWEAYAPIEERWYARMGPAQAPAGAGVASAAGAAGAASHPLQTVRHNASKRCWEGYEATPGKKPYSDGSCQKKKGSGSGSDSSSSSSESDGEGGRRKKKKAEKKQAEKKESS